MGRWATTRLEVVALVALVALPAGCDRAAGPEAGPEAGRASSTGPSTQRAEPQAGSGPARKQTGRVSEPARSGWVLGATPLPLRPDGFGEVRPTPHPLRVRRLATVDRLPPPEGDEFVATVGPVTRAVRDRMGATWAPRCPVGLDELRYLTLSFRGFDGAAHTGEIVVAASQADGVVSVFRALYAVGFPIEEMRLPGTADLEAHPTGDGNNTAGYVCRPSTGQTQWSAHAYGLAVDINPFLNPYLRGDLVLPELASSYLDRSWRRPGMVLAGGPAVRAFARIGWSWGGAWTSVKDYQHFSALDR